MPALGLNNRRPGRISAAMCVGVAIIASVVSVSAAWGHGAFPPRNYPPPPPPPPPSESYVVNDIDIRYIYPARWSWVHWWEANRDRYLLRSRQDQPQQMSDEVRAKLRNLVEVQLVDSLKHPNAGVRAYAILALSRAGWPGDVRSHQALMAQDRDPEVQWRALLGLGLQDRADGRALILDFMPEVDETRMAWLHAFQVSSTIEDPVRERLWQVVSAKKPWRGAMPKTVRQLLPDRNDDLAFDSPEVAAAMAAIGPHVTAADVGKIHARLSQDASPWVASDALLALGRSGHAGAVATLQATVSTASLDAPNVRETTGAHRWLKARESKSWDIIGAKRKQVRTIPEGDPKPTVRYRVLMGIENIYAARLRASAIIALGMHGKAVAERPLLDVVLEADTEHNALPKGMAIVALGEMQSEQAAPILARLLRGRTADASNDTRLSSSSTLPGYAAIAIGLYARPIETV